MPDLQSNPEMTEEKAKDQANVLYQVWQKGFWYEKFFVLIVPILLSPVAAYYHRPNESAFFGGMLTVLIWHTGFDYLKNRKFILTKMPLLLMGKEIL